MKSLNAALTALQGYHRLTLSKWDSVTAGRLGSALSSPSGMCYHCCEVSSEGAESTCGREKSKLPPPRVLIRPCDGRCQHQRAGRISCDTHTRWLAKRADGVAPGVQCGEASVLRGCGFVPPPSSRARPCPQALLLGAFPVRSWFESLCLTEPD